MPPIAGATPSLNSISKPSMFDQDEHSSTKYSPSHKAIITLANKAREARCGVTVHVFRTPSR